MKLGRTLNTTQFFIEAANVNNYIPATESRPVIQAKNYESLKNCHFHLSTHMNFPARQSSHCDVILIHQKGLPSLMNY
jgi:hypothetical protein